MKFGKQIRLLAKAEWLEEYIDYKALKGIVRGGFPFLDADEAYESDDSIAGDPKERARKAAHREKKHAARRETPQQKKFRFEMRLNEQLDKSRKFYVSKIVEIAKLLQKLRKSVEFARNDGDLSQQLSSDTHAAVQANGTVSNIIEKDHTVSYGQEQGEVTAEPFATPEQKEFMEIAEMITGLRDFSSLNITAIQKITKKFDKHHGTELREKYEGILENDPIADTQELDRLDHETENFVREIGPAVTRRTKTATSLVVEPVVRTVTKLDLASLPSGKVTHLYVQLGTDPLSNPITVPIMVAKGSITGPCVGITSALHGNELNGIPLIHRLFSELEIEKLCGCIVAIPVVNIHGYVRYQRGYSDGVDLNRIMPGKKHGSGSQKFAYNFCKRILHTFDYLLDMHTASFGRVNSLYVRADMNDTVSNRLAKLCIPQIIVHNTGPDGSLRGAASGMGIAAVTIEIGNPQRFHSTFIERAYQGLLNVVSYMNVRRAA